MNDVINKLQQQSTIIKRTMHPRMQRILQQIFQTTIITIKKYFCLTKYVSFFYNMYIAYVYVNKVMCILLNLLAKYSQQFSVIFYNLD